MLRGERKEYLAIQVKGMEEHWIWFESARTKHEGHFFVGEAGWCDGSTTDIHVDFESIIGWIDSDCILQT